MGIFVTGGRFSVFQGVQAFRSGGSESHDGYVFGLLVLLLALVTEGASLGRAARAQLIGEAADPAVRREVREFLVGQPEIDTVAALLTMRLGPDSVLPAARIDLTPGYASETVEGAMVRIRRQARGRRPELDQVFLDVTDADAAYGRTHRSDA
ncbi:hypothetical protein ABZW32_31255 [Streptomyces sp. NPDC004667]|uniref:hypothetical protein n=1 Tax=Streptomyces sp. NPDC004667 TaxID=3154285 RepID=UPI0033A37142